MTCCAVPSPVSDSWNLSWAWRSCCAKWSALGGGVCARVMVAKSYRVDDPDAADSQADEDALDQGIARRRGLVEARDEVGDRDIDHARGGEGEDLGHPAAHGGKREVGDERARHGRHSRNRVPQE